MKRIVVANGPNLNLLGTREPEIYGRRTLADLEKEVRARARQLGCQVVFFQSNSEGELIDRLQKEAPGAAGIVINPAALTHYSYALYDCLRSLAVPALEVHISNPLARPEEFRWRSVTAPAAVGVISGLGFRGYLVAMEFLLDLEQ
ncbi:MAG TPA: type II 3-dehydroquinate dehydratase [Candidatus Acidoferrales bacterium]|nr:type II 3-dehydroquinate dehydratase [Candidatus Acidoferrales bacterium]